jgi:hypothetical protein
MYAIEMGSYISNFIKKGSDIRKLIGEHIQIHTDRKIISKAYFYFFKIGKVGQK